MKKNKILLLLSLVGLSSCTVIPTLSVNSSSSVSHFESSFSSSLSSSSENITEGYYELYNGLYVNYMPGIYSDMLELEFLITNENYALYYTRDCSRPRKNPLMEYTKPLIINMVESQDVASFPMTTSVDGILSHYGNDKCTSNAYNVNIQTNHEYYFLPRQTVITISLYDNELEAEILNRSLTYIIDPKGKIEIPVVSLSMPYSDWFGDSTGFYNKIKDEIEKRANLEYYDPEYDEYFYRNTQVKLGGNWTLGYPQRTLNLNFNKDENGNKNKPVDAHIFRERQTRDRSGRLDSLTRMRLHNGGNCFEEFTGVNDALLQAMMEDNENVSTTGYRPCLAYLNGEYWGLYYLREHYKDTYFATNYGVDKDDVIFYELKGDYIYSDGDEVLGQECITEFVNYINNHDFTNNTVYQTFIDEYIDIDSFIDVVVANAYASNWDFLGNFNNLKMWRTYSEDKTNKYADKKWRFVMHDSDFAFREDVNYLDSSQTHSYSKLPLMNKLLSNDSFKERFYERARALVQTNLTASRGTELLDEMIYEIYDYKLESQYRWGQKEDYYDYWEGQINYVYNYLKNKESTFLNLVKESLNQY